ncbi:MAG: hypothetical protein IJ809_03000 [Clostridia bacterium]|nr:hypothetical protein [Clostridia bacterium]
MFNYNLTRISFITSRYAFGSMTKAELAKEISTQNEKVTSKTIDGCIRRAIFWGEAKELEISALCKKEDCVANFDTNVKSILADKEEYKKCVIMINKIHEYFETINKLQNRTFYLNKYTAFEKIILSSKIEEFEEYFRKFFSAESLKNLNLNAEKSNFVKRSKELEKKYNIDY